MSRSIRIKPRGHKVIFDQNGSGVSLAEENLISDGFLKVMQVLRSLFEALTQKKDAYRGETFDWKSSTAFHSSEDSAYVRVESATFAFHISRKMARISNAEVKSGNGGFFRYGAHKMQVHVVNAIRIEKEGLTAIRQNTDVAIPEVGLASSIGSSATQVSGKSQIVPISLETLNESSSNRIFHECAAGKSLGDFSRLLNLTEME